MKPAKLECPYCAADLGDESIRVVGKSFGQSFYGTINITCECCKRKIYTRDFCDREDEPGVYHAP